MTVSVLHFFHIFEQIVVGAVTQFEDSRKEHQSVSADKQSNSDKIPRQHSKVRKSVEVTFNSRYEPHKH